MYIAEGGESNMSPGREAGEMCDSSNELGVEFVIGDFCEQCREMSYPCF